VNDEYSLEFPKLYTPGLTAMFFNKKIFALSLLEGILTSCGIFFFSYGCLIDGIEHDGKDMVSLETLSFMSSSILIAVVTLRVSIAFNHYSKRL